MIFNINSTRGQTRFLTCVARVTCLVRNKRSQGRRSGYESGGDGIHVNPERSFGGTNGEPPSEASQGGSGGPPPENFKNLDGKWCNLRYS